MNDVAPVPPLATVSADVSDRFAPAIFVAEKFVEVALVVVPLTTLSEVIEDDAFEMIPPLRERSVVVALSGKR